MSEELGNDETLAAGSGDVHATSARQSSGELARGDVVGRYVVLAKLGEGGMGVVHAAYDPELDRKVAIKLLHARVRSGDESGARRRLVREAQALAKLSHPNVIAVHDVGEHGDRVYVAMEFVEGETLRGWLEKHRTHQEVLDAVLRAGRGLRAAHEKGLVHRDFKPDNVMVGTDGRVRVMDFGLARATSGVTTSRDEEPDATPTTDALASDLTRKGSIVGTPAYMAPEQHAGSEVDARSDQFSFCVTAWEAFHGERPFGGATLAALVFNVTQGKLREPSGRHKMPPWLRRIVERGIAVEPRDRWPSMAALIEAAELGKARRRRRVWFGAAATLAVAGGAAWGAYELDRGRRLAQCWQDASAIAGAWDEERKGQLREALAGTGVSYAALEPVTEDAAAQVRAQLLSDEARQLAVPVAQPRDERFEIALQCAVQRCALGAMTFVGERALLCSAAARHVRGVAAVVPTRARAISAGCVRGIERGGPWAGRGGPTVGHSRRSGLNPECQHGEGVPTGAQLLCCLAWPIH